MKTDFNQYIIYGYGNNSGTTTLVKIHILLNNR